MTTKPYKDPMPVDRKACAKVAVVALLGAIGCTSEPAPPAMRLTADERQQLVRLVTPVADLVAEGWVVATEPEQNDGSCYSYWAFNARRQVEGSVTIGYYGVDAGTGEVFDAVLFQPLDSVALRQAQEALRTKYGVTSEQVEWFRGRCYGEGPSSTAHDG